MAVISNDRDIILQGSALRLVSVETNYISLTASENSFTVLNGVASPTSITITAILFGQLQGLPSLSVISGASSISLSTVGGRSVATLAYTSLTADVAVIRASLSYFGITYFTDIRIGGQTVRPAQVTGFVAAPQASLLKLSWARNIDADIMGYEVRDVDSGWGDANFLFRGSVNSAVVTPGVLNVPEVWYIRAFDTSNLYSLVSTSVTYTVVRPVSIGPISSEFADTSLTNATVTLRWDSVEPLFGLKEYKVSYFSESRGVNTFDVVRNTNITLPADWLGSKMFTVEVIDMLGNSSLPTTQTITKGLPNPVTALKAQVIDNNVLLSWIIPPKTSLPVLYVILKKGNVGGTYATATLVGTKSGEFTSIQELAKGTYVYYVVAVDTDNNESVPVSVTAEVQQPPDFIFNSEFVTTTFPGTKVNAGVTEAGLTLPINTTETWTQHFNVNNTFASPQAQINAGFPIYIQPGVASGSYEQVFDYGNGQNLILASSNISVGIEGGIVTGSATVVTSISYSTDNVTYTTPVATNALFGTNFRFIKVKIDVNRITVGAIYAINRLTVRLDSKLKTDSGFTNVLSTNTQGTIINFNTEFIDVSSINVTPTGTAVRIPVYEFTDSILTGTFTSTTTVITVNVTAHGLIAGQRVRLSTANAAIPAGVYTIATVVNANQYTINYNGVATSGTIFTYPNSMRVRVFDSAGTLQTQGVSWTVRGA